MTPDEERGQLVRWARMTLADNSATDELLKVADNILSLDDQLSHGGILPSAWADARNP